MIRIWILVLFFFSTLGQAAQLKSITLGQQANKTVLHLSIQGAFTHHLLVLTNPNRLVLDLTNTHLTTSSNQLHLTNNLIRAVRSGHPNAKTLRLVFDLGQKVGLSSAPWRQAGSNGLEIVLSPAGPVAVQINNAHKLPIKKLLQPAIQNKLISQSQAVQFHQTPSKVLQTPTNVHPSMPITMHNKPIKATHVPSLNLRDVVVVLDAGHGGKDPGARGPRLSREKDVVLAITLKLKQLIDKQPGMHAVLTRSGDYYVGLRNRLDIARRYNGDVFVSIHADAFKNPHSNGASVFALSQSGATSEAARWLAEKENYSELGGVNLGDLDDRNGVVRSVLIDLSQTATINAGLQMGKGVLNRLGTFTSLHNFKVEQARFMVLKSPDIPSILVETGFISNPREEGNLTSSSYQMRLSQAIFQGIKAYFWESPPHGSRIEAMSSKLKRVHLARAGETMSSIARDNHVSVASLSAMNHLWASSIPKPGQKLVIPSAWS
ncbi:MAG: N-acetylmuramoyl-L-alanine amidase [Legionella sp.]|nr:N-acetylmuramoyl-L-alanine amidase [Legionella sp.]